MALGEDINSGGIAVDTVVGVVPWHRRGSLCRAKSPGYAVEGLGVAFIVSKAGSKRQGTKAVHAALTTMSHICSLLAIGQLEPPISEDVYVSAWTHNYSAHSFTVPTSEPYRKLNQSLTRFPSKSHQVHSLLIQALIFITCFFPLS